MSVIVSNDAWAALVGAMYPYLYLFMMALMLQSPLGHRRIPRIIMGVCISSFVLATHPLVYSSDNQVFGPTLAFFCGEVAWTLLHWTFMEPLERRVSVLDVLASHLQHSTHGVCKVYQRSKQKQGAERVQTRESATAQQQQLVPGSGVKSDGKGTVPWVFAVLRALEAVARVSLLYDVAFYVLCHVSSFCDPGNSPGVLQSVRSAAGTSTGGFWHRLAVSAAAYVRLCPTAFIAALPMGLQLDLVYCWLNLALHVAAFLLPQLRGFCAQLPYDAFSSPWKAATLGELWGRRRHQFLRYHLESLGYTAVSKLLDNAAPRAVVACMRGVAAFFMSAVTHEYMTWAAYGTLTGCYMAFFGVHYFAVMVEAVWLHVVGPALQEPLPLGLRLLGRCWVWAVSFFDSPSVL